MTQKKHLYFSLVIIVFLILSCNLPMLVEPTLSPEPLAPALDGSEQAAAPQEDLPQPPSEEMNAPAPGEDEQAASPPPVDLGPPPAFDEITWPEGIDSPEERDGKWYLNDQPVALSYHQNAEGEKELWLTLENETDWPIMIQGSDGEWKAGLEAWDGNLTIVNTNDTPLTLNIFKLVEGKNPEEPYTYEIDPYEILNLASLPPTLYQFQFQFTTDTAYDLACDTDMRQHSPLTFTVVPAGVAVSKPDFVPNSGRDLDLLYSPLCGGGL